jgi:membrane-associated protease RseP (regulator of RpoE activity)
VESTNQPYLLPEVQPSSSQGRTDRATARARDRELAPGRVLLHAGLFCLTAVSTTITGASLAMNWQGEPVTMREAVISGLLFTATLLLILAAHEFGHYFACRYYGIRATLPYFIPAPPIVTLFGTFGAVIKIKEPIRTRRALFDIGIAGPLAGFALALPASVIGLWMARPVTPGQGGSEFLDPPLFKIIIALVGAPHYFDWNPFYWASWAALLVTTINLFPVGQLDGGHVLYAVAGPRIHKWVSRITCLAVAALATRSLIVDGSPIWILWTFVLLFLLKVGHPPVADGEPLGKARLILAVVAVIVFLLCFHPSPVRLNW